MSGLQAKKHVAGLCHFPGPCGFQHACQTFVRPADSVVSRVDNTCLHASGAMCVGGVLAGWLPVQLARNCCCAKRQTHTSSLFRFLRFHAAYAHGNLHACMHAHATDLHRVRLVLCVCATSRLRMRDCFLAYRAPGAVSFPPPRVPHPSQRRTAYAQVRNPDLAVPSASCAT